MKGKYPDTAMRGGIPGNYPFMNVIVQANMEGMIHGRLVKFTGVMNFIHIDDHEIFYRHPPRGAGRMKLDTFLSRLEQVKRRGGQWAAKSESIQKAAVQCMIGS